VPADLCRSNTVTVGGGTHAWGDLADASAAGLAGRADPAAERLAFLPSSPEGPFAAAAFLASREADGLILPAGRATETMRSLLAAGGFTIVEDGTEPARPPAAPEVRAGRVAIFTSGTTGDPKLLHHSWRSLDTMGHITGMEPRCWLLPYAAGTYAWYQLVTLSLFKEGQTLVAADPRDTEAFFAAGAAAGANAMSSTPTFWRFALARLDAGRLRALDLRQISLGGEIVDQEILDRLRALFPEARLNHIYASTEVGACLSVGDGRAGFPVEWLDSDRHRNFQFRIADGTLRVRSAFASTSVRRDEDGWVDTGDRVEVRGDRVYFVGRVEGSMINVGGSKAYPADVERVLLGHPAVRWCRVHARRAPLVGYLAAAEVVADGTPAELETALTRWCGERLPDFAVPRIWTFLEEIPMAATLKSARMTPDG
jgi:acyl-coenzyme A synthetase/AMP-(fatty) acid ligase